MDAGHALWRRGGGYQKHQIQTMGRCNGGELFGFLQGQIRHHQASGPGGGGGGAKGLHAAVEQWIGVGEQHHRQAELPLEFGQHCQYGGGGGAGGQGAAGGGLDHRTIGQGIAVGDAQFDQVCAIGLQGQQGGFGGGQIRIASHQKGHQGTATLGPQPLEALLDQAGGRGGRHGGGHGDASGAGAVSLCRSSWESPPGTAALKAAFLWAVVKPVAKPMAKPVARREVLSSRARGPNRFGRFPAAAAPVRRG